MYIEAGCCQVFFLDTRNAWADRPGPPAFLPAFPFVYTIPDPYFPELIQNNTQLNNNGAII